MPKKIDPDFKVTDRLTEWSENRFGYSELPFLFISEFKNHFIAKGTKYDNWDKCFMNWINKWSPSGDYYDAKKWEDKINICKLELNKKKPPEAIKEYLTAFKKPPKPISRESCIKAMQALKSVLND